MDPITKALQLQQQNQEQQPSSPIPSAVDQLRSQNQQAQQQFGQQQATLQQQGDLALQGQQNQQAAIAQAAASLQPNSKDKLSAAGRAIATPAYAGYCLQYVDDKTGNANRQPTAFADYQANAANNNIKVSGDIPKGARVYFAPDSSNGGMGHVGLSNGDGTFTSATDNGIKKFSLGDWVKYTGQTYLGYAAPTKK